MLPEAYAELEIVAALPHPGRAYFEVRARTLTGARPITRGMYLIIFLPERPQGDEVVTGTPIAEAAPLEGDPAGADTALLLLYDSADPLGGWEGIIRPGGRLEVFEERPTAIRDAEVDVYTTLLRRPWWRRWLGV